MNKVRLKFSKNGPIRFIGHLDVMRYFQKVNRRAEVDIKHSEGYSPHQILSFALPLSVGATSDGEYLDMTLNSLDSIENLITRMNAVMHEGIVITDGKELPEITPKAMTIVAAAEYLVSFRQGKEPECDWESLLMEYYASEHMETQKKTKSGEKTIDMKTLIYRMEVTPEHGVHMLVSAGSVDHLKPSLIMESFLHTQNEELKPFALSVHRIDTYLQGQDESGTYIEPLICREEDGKRVYL